MNAPFTHERHQPAFRPIGHDAPKHSVEWTNYQAACIAAREVRGRAIHCPEHRQSLEEWSRGERASPWPDSAVKIADAALRGLIDGLLSDSEMRFLTKGARAFNRNAKRGTL